MSNGDKPSPKDIDLMRAYVERAWAICEDRDKAPYNGILGTPPAWFPEPALDDFKRLRTNVLSATHDGNPITNELALAWLEESVAMHTRNNAESFSIPWEFLESIGKLAHYRYVASLGEHKGLPMLAGKDG